MKSTRQKHDYTSELELKSLLMRIKNDKEGITNKKYNDRINKYIKWHTAINAKKYTTDIQKKNIIKNKIKDKVVELSKETGVDKQSYEKFGEIVLLMISKILTKPQFSGYTYRDEFFSDAVYKILKYLHNFKYDMISERTGQPVNSFAYISQYIHNSVLYIINTKKKEHDKIKQQISTSILDHNYNLKDYNQTYESTYHPDEHKNFKEEVIHLKKLDGSLNDFITDLDVEEFDSVKVYYPADYTISFDEYNLIKDNLKGKISIIKEKEKK